MKHVFTYGSLMFDEVWSQVVRGKYRSTALTLTGFLCKGVKGEHYPALIETQRKEDRVIGRLYFNVDPKDLSRLDMFEGTKYQRYSTRVKITEKQTISCDYYLWRPRYKMLLTEQDWNIDDFRRRGLKLFTDKYQGYFRIGSHA